MVSAVVIIILAVTNVWSYTNLNTLQTQINSLNNTYQDYVKTHSYSNSEYVALQSQMDQLQDQIESLNNTVVLLNEEMENLNQNYISLSRNYTSLLAERNSLLQNYTKLIEVYQCLLSHCSSFEVLSLMINPNEVEEGDSVNISVVVKNIGGIKGSYTITLKLNGTIEKTQDVIIEGYESLNVSFLVTKTDVGTYNVDVNGLIGTFTVKKSPWCEIGVPYKAPDGLTVTLNSLTIIEKTGSYQYAITCTLKNENPDKKIDEGSFKMYYKDALGGLPQYGFFGVLFPGDTITRSYTFEELKSKPFNVLEYLHG